MASQDAGDAYMFPLPVMHVCGACLSYAWTESLKY